jgi:hypothetical protein
MQGAGIGTGGLSKVDEIHRKNGSSSPRRSNGAAISAGNACSCKTSVSKITIDDNHFTLCSLYGGCIGPDPR